VYYNYLYRSIFRTAFKDMGTVHPHIMAIDSGHFAIVLCSFSILEPTVKIHGSTLHGFAYGAMLNRHTHISARGAHGSWCPAATTSGILQADHQHCCSAKAMAELLPVQAYQVCCGHHHPLQERSVNVMTSRELSEILIHKGLPDSVSIGCYQRLLM
jgi:hypothetical protein